MTKQVRKAKKVREVGQKRENCPYQFDVMHQLISVWFAMMQAVRSEGAAICFESLQSNPNSGGDNRGDGNGEQRATCLHVYVYVCTS